MRSRCTWGIRLSPYSLRRLDQRRLPRRWLARAAAPARADGWRRSAQDVSGERRLAYAVLEDALRVLSRAVGRPERWRSAEVRQARDWLFSDDCDWPYAFRNLCDALDLAADDLRRRAVRWVEEMDSPTVCGSAKPVA